MEDYIDLTNSETNLDNYSIERSGYECFLNDGRKRYFGFLLARSEHGNAYTLCDIDFHHSQTDDKFPPRLTFRRTDSNLKDKAVRKNMDFATVTFKKGDDGYRQFWTMIAFLSKFKNLLDTEEFFERYQVVTKQSVVTSLKERQPSERMQEIAHYIEESGLRDQDMSELLAVRARKQDVVLFHQLLYDINDARTTYRNEHQAEIKGAGAEAIWHHFLKNRKWIFGLSLNLRFIEDLADEQSVGIADTENHGSPRVDMLGYSDYIVLIELKTPDTDMFTSTKTKNARANTWSFSNEFIEGFSQCLAQKSDWQKSSDVKPLVKEGRSLDRGVIRTIDPQAIFIVGNKEREVPRDSDLVDIQTKRDTLERFIRNNRNVNIISYDELYRRACHIVQEEPLPEPVLELEEIDWF